MLCPIPLKENQELINKIYTMTGGLPIPIKEFTEEYEKNQSNDIQVLVGNYYKAYVRKDFLGAFDPEIDTFLILALLRKFNVKTMHKIMPKLNEGDFGDYKTVDYLDLIDRLRPWVEWRRQGGYAVNPALQLMLRGYVLTMKPDMYEQVHGTMSEMYEKRLQAEFYENDLIELLFHDFSTIKVNSDKSKEKIGERLFERIEQVMKSLQPEEIEFDVDSFCKLLDQDPDLKEYSSYLRERLSNGINHKAQIGR